MTATCWVLTIAPPHTLVRAPARPCAECGWDCPLGHWAAHLCDACYMRRWRRRRGLATRRYYPRGLGCQVCGEVPRAVGGKRGRGLTRGLCHRHYMARWREQRRAA